MQEVHALVVAYGSCGFIPEGMGIIHEQCDATSPEEVPVVARAVFADGHKEALGISVEQMLDAIPAWIEQSRTGAVRVRCSAIVAA